ncbi:MAG: hypothetical protein AAF585_29030, partial [Verrucomicrobiota bacterium]
FICQALDGPLTYSGRSMSEVHHGRGIQQRHFQKWVDHFLDTLGESPFELSMAEIDDVVDRVVVDADSIVGETAFGG